MRRTGSSEKTLMLGKIEGKRRKGQWRLKWLDGITNSMDVSFRKFRKMVKDREAWHAAVHGVTKSQMRLSNWTISLPITWKSVLLHTSLWSRPLVEGMQESTNCCSAWGPGKSKASLWVTVTTVSSKKAGFFKMGKYLPIFRNLIMTSVMNSWLVKILEDNFKENYNMNF